MLRYFANAEEQDGKWIVKSVYMAEHDDPVCQVLLDKGFIESEETWRKETIKWTYGKK
jgi:hypothetical protein